ncbi:butyryl-CoA:acetate CoA-transferase [Desulfotomaculum arcticum]|uniref:Probable butyrate:acetyl-CoA coenzyme A-transferase n=1 Tax=Desulfotruncus arcticus DSM 17038 TaxID=1121424 RepID=A0A1I2UEF6_9FIRM|nr:acetyl-CoA hydrolase/transferase C-terminal domain-containing protein [Desulfotruncus arcticus]SFG75393.1 butyryl-CoA:acetate CoA-transferase [Desulfotomaculum arcticum] [Desulfotruncus arcticus DSM 17038]
MNYHEEYKYKLRTADEAVKVIKPGDLIDYGTFANQVVEIDKALAKRKPELKDVYIRSAARVYGPPMIVLSDPQGESFNFNSGHFTLIDRRVHDYGLCHFLPILFRECPSYANYTRSDVAMVSVAPMDEHGYFNFGLSNTFTRAVMDIAPKVIVEVNPQMPRVPGGNNECVHISEVDMIVEADWNVPPIPEIPISEVDQKIAMLIMNELEDGACIQLGIGGMPNALGKLIAQSDLKDLGAHTEMLCDAYLDMWEAGKLTGKRKNIDTGKMVFTFALGSKKLYDFLHNNPSVASYSVDYTNYPHIIAQNDKVMSINGALEVDLFSQVASESTGSRQISGTGGQVDFVEGAYLSRGGKAFLCLPSTYKDKNGELHSRIKPTLSPGTIVTTPRSMVMYLVTENGMVNLKCKSTWERAEALISLAHPNFQEELIKEAEKMKIWTKSNKKPTACQTAS